LNEVESPEFQAPSIRFRVSGLRRKDLRWAAARWEYRATRCLCLSQHGEVRPFHQRSTCLRPEMGGCALGVEGCEDGRLRPYGTVHTIAGRSVERSRLRVVHHTYGRVLGRMVSYERGTPANPMPFRRWRCTRRRWAQTRTQKRRRVWAGSHCGFEAGWAAPGMGGSALGVEGCEDGRRSRIAIGL